MVFRSGSRIRTHHQSRRNEVADTLFERPAGMDDGFGRVWQEIAAWPDGPMAMRFYLQPIMAIIFALRDGLKDVRVGSRHLWVVVSQPERRGRALA